MTKNANLFIFFLSSLYVFTSDVVKSGEEEVIKELALLLEKVSNFAKTEQLNAWIERSKHLIQHPRDYNYDYWGLESKYVDKYLYPFLQFNIHVIMVLFKYT
ncbi:hypothetical protein QOZ95_000593 [Paenibacillus brasilensis]|uniref:Uncharacterized protein n=1 Tax=Paenibacillus brasilensis TaxID=128574 RepID=A0ABU0KVM9_9BACL|nr:hypothetical protein [Paenibacillus brasilensis]